MENSNKKSAVIIVLILIILVLVAGIIVLISTKTIVFKDNVKETLNNDTNNTTKTEVIEVEKKVEVAKIMTFDYSKARNVDANSINNYNGRIYKRFDNGNGLIYNLVITQNGKATMYVNDDLINGIEYPINNSDSGFVVDAMIGYWGITGDTQAYLLMRDGTVFKVTGFDKFKQNGFNCEKVNNVKDVVRLELIVNAGSKRIPIAIDKEGYYFAL